MLAKGRASLPPSRVFGCVSMEIELKLLLPAGAGGLRRHPLLAAVKSQRRLLHTLYFDTADWRLARAGAALRVRREGRGWVQTFKSEGQGMAGYSARLEEAAEVAGPWPEVARLQAPEAHICTRLGGELAVRFETRFWRQAWLVVAEGSRVEIALDAGSIRAQGREAPIAELELELKAGDPEALFELALALAEAAPLWPSEASKARRGVALARGEEAGPAKAGACVLRADMKAAQGLRLLCGNAFTQLLDNLPGIVEGGDAEYLHQARVGLRRLRAALKLGAKLASPPAATLKGLAELGQLLGEARDWDVQDSAVLPALLGAWPDQEAAVRLRAGVEGLRREAHAVLGRHLLEPSVSRLLLLLARWLASPAAPRGDERVTKWAHGSLRRYWRSLQGRLGEAAGATDADIHALRLAVKRLRYALDFFHHLVGEEAHALARRLGRLQDDLGHYNDRCVAVRCLERAAARMGVASTEFGAGWLAAEKIALRAALRKDCAELAKTRARW